MRTEPSITPQWEKARLLLGLTTSRKERLEIGQFLTPAPIAGFMASLFEKPRDEVRILDAGAGVGGLFAELVATLCSRDEPPESIRVVAYESDGNLVPHLERTMNDCQKTCTEIGVHFYGTVLCEDFISAAIADLDDGLFGGQSQRYTHAILNPPYKKIGGETRTRRLLNAAGLEASNLYAAFVWLSAQLLLPGGEIVAITPRSFCNGPYFRKFRKALLQLISLRRIHLFQSRKEAFADDSVLQENIILYGVRGERQPTHVSISVLSGPGFDHVAKEATLFRHVVLPGDTDDFIHLTEDDEGKQVMRRMTRFSTTLDELGLAVSTGRVVDFRAREYLRRDAGPETAPLVYPCHFDNGFVRWPLSHGRKPNAIVSSDQTRNLLVKKGWYVLTKRFSAKEERRRVVAVIHDPGRIDAPLIGFENHLNYFHAKGEGMPEELARGLLVFLNSTLLDQFFRLFSGHTQVNATDLRKIRYPSLDQILLLGESVKNCMPDQETLDDIVEHECA
ncbi:MAG: Eco57I restriction-modification methylase domain-containing protein [Pseudomonadota bacterium]